MAWHYLLSSDPRRLSVHVQCLPCPNSLAAETSESFTYTGFRPLFVFATTITIRCLQEMNTGYLLSVVTSTSEGKQESDCEYLD